jgi:hypothetical protein
MILRLFDDGIQIESETFKVTLQALRAGIVFVQLPSIKQS